jgi:hypothetical protein
MEKIPQKGNKDEKKCEIFLDGTPGFSAEGKLMGRMGLIRLMGRMGPMGRIGQMGVDGTDGTDETDETDGTKGTKAMTIQVAVLCDAATDYNGKLNLLGTFDTIYAPQMPTATSPMFHRHSHRLRPQRGGRHILNLNFVDEDGQPIMKSMQIPVEVDFPADATFISRNLVVNILQLTFSKTGLYSVDLSMDERPLVEHSAGGETIGAEAGMTAEVRTGAATSDVFRFSRASQDRPVAATQPGAGPPGARLFVRRHSLEELEAMARTLAKTVNCLSPPRRAASGLPLGVLRPLRQLPPHRSIQSSRCLLDSAGIQVARHHD